MFMIMHAQKSKSSFASIVNSANLFHLMKSYSIEMRLFRFIHSERFSIPAGQHYWCALYN